MSTSNDRPTGSNPLPTSLNSLWKQIVENKVLAFLLAVLSILIGLGSYWLSGPTVEPVYRVYPTESVARPDSPRLTVLWDGRPIPNLCVARVGIWNAGKASLRQSDLPPADPLRIASTPGVAILSVQATNSSRNHGQVVAQLKPTDPSNVYLSIATADALDSGDGVVFRLLFTGDCSASEFGVYGRVVGTRNGFARWSDPQRPTTIFDQMRSVGGQLFLFLAFIFALRFAIEIAPASWQDGSLADKLRVGGMIATAPLLAGLILYSFFFSSPRMPWLPL